MPRRKVAILRPLGLGDFLTALPAFRGIRRHYIDAEIVLASPDGHRDLALFTGLFDRVVDTRPLAPLAPEFDEVDVAIDLHGRGPQSMRLLLDVRPARLIAFAHDDVPETHGMAPWQPREHEVRRWCRMLRVAGIACDPSELDLAVPPIDVPAFARGATVIHPGAASESRRWPRDRWAAVARAECARGREVILTGSENEREAAIAIADASGVPNSRVFAGRTSLLELAALVNAADRVLCGDTGVAHLATALRRPSVVLFGPISPSEWGPPQRAYHIALWAGENGNPHAERIDSGLLRIGVSDVLAALAKLDPDVA